MIIDCHVHLGHSKPLEIHVTQTGYLELMDKHGIDKTLVFGTQHNRNDYDFTPSPRFYQWHYCDMNNSHETPIPNMIGFKIHGTIDRVDYLSKQAKDKIATLGPSKPFILHCSGRRGEAAVEKALHLASQFPKHKFILCHMGTTNLEKCLQFWHVTDRIPPNVWFDSSSIKNGAVMDLAYSKIGAEKIIFGTDYPWCSPGVSVQLIREMNIPEEEKEMIFSKNIQGLVDL